jgi:hypothetical protein
LDFGAQNPDFSQNPKNVEKVEKVQNLAFGTPKVLLEPQKHEKTPKLGLQKGKSPIINPKNVLYTKQYIIRWDFAVRKTCPKG